MIILTDKFGWSAKCNFFFKKKIVFRPVGRRRRLILSQGDARLSLLRWHQLQLLVCCPIHYFPANMVLFYHFYSGAIRYPRLCTRFGIFAGAAHRIRFHSMHTPLFCTEMYRVLVISPNSWRTKIPSKTRPFSKPWPATFPNARRVSLHQKRPQPRGRHPSSFVG